MNRPIDKAVSLVGGEGRGKVTRAAKRFGISAPYLHKIIRTGHVPVEQCRSIEAATMAVDESKAVTVDMLRPDIFKSPEAA